MRHLKRNIVLALMIGTVAALAGVASAAYTTTINPANAPSGTHIQSGAIGCSGTLSVSCTSFELAGVGNTNATLSTSATYSATIDCFNPGGNLVETHETTFSQDSTQTLTSSKNGRLRVPAVSVSPDTSVAEVCPNPNWTPTIREGTLTLDSFTYTLTFAGFTNPYITITGP
jgi:hypothetical protein